jgi:ABC-type dipeptide/oligopeptide/nickel transport system permease component
VEQMVAMPAMCTCFITRGTDCHYPEVMGTTPPRKVIPVLANLAVDITYALLNPHIWHK